ncbi:glucarate dehydratase, partial [Raoultella planticola]
MTTQFSTPVVTAMQVIPVAGHDSMLMNLSGAHAPYFTRNIVIIKDNSGHTGVGEIPGGEKIRQTLEEAAELVVGKALGEYKNVLGAVRGRFADRDAAAAGCKLLICVPPFTLSQGLRPRCWICWGSIWASTSPLCWAMANQRSEVENAGLPVLRR